MKKGFGAVIPSPFAIPLRTALSEAKGLRVNSARNLLLHAAPENKADSSVAQRTPDFGMTPSRLFQQPVKEVCRH